MVKRKVHEAVKLVTDELKLEAYLDYCKHIAEGKCKEAWYFRDHKRLLCEYRTIEKYMKLMPELLQPIHMHIAQCKALEVWENKGLNIMDGKVRGAQPVIYQIMMRNKFGWDKEEKRSEQEDRLAELKNHALHDEHIRKKIQEEASPELP